MFLENRSEIRATLAKRALWIFLTAAVGITAATTISLLLGDGVRWLPLAVVIAVILAAQVFWPAWPHNGSLPNSIDLDNSAQNLFVAPLNSPTAVPPNKRVYTNGRLYPLDHNVDRPSRPRKT